MTNGWFERDEWWEGTAPALFGARAWRNAPDEVARVLALAALEPPIHVLDLPCGVGRHTIEFARLGCTVTAVDRTAIYLAQAQTRIEEAGLQVEFIQADMRDFRRSEAYDLVVNLFTSFGYFEDQEDDLKELTNFYASLRPGGVLIMDLMGREVLARNFVPRAWRELEDGTLLLEEHKVVRDWTWMEARWIMIKDGERREYPLTHRIYSASDLKQLLVQAGFTLIRIYGSLAGTPYDHLAERLVVAAHKPASA